MPPPRILPILNDLNRPFWTGGHQGRLLIQRCVDCGRWQHPPAARCAACGGSPVPEPVSGHGTVFTYTVNSHQYHLEVPPPYVIAVVELDEQDDLRLAASVQGCSESELHIGLPVSVTFEDCGEHAVPVFVPEEQL